MRTVTEMYKELIKALRCQRIGCGDCSMQDMELVEADHTHHTYAQHCIAHKAADAIEELAKDLERSKDYESFWNKEAEEALRRFQLAVANNPRWIPVTEQLPECEWGAEVGNIEWINCGMVFAGCFGRGGKYRDAYFRTWTDGTEGIDAKDADYWRPIQIPQPPKEDKTS